MVGYSAKYGVAKRPSPTGSFGNRGIHCCMRRNTRPVELVGTQPEDGPYLRFDTVVQESVDKVVASSTHSGRSVDQVGNKRPVPSLKITTIQRRSKGQVRVGAIAFDATKHL
jgi:hypothetical protein